MGTRLAYREGNVFDSMSPLDKAPDQSEIQARRDEAHARRGILLFFFLSSAAIRIALGAPLEYDFGL